MGAIIRVELTGDDALEWIRQHEGRRTARPPSIDACEAAILAVLRRGPMAAPELYERAGLPRPWIRAGHALRRLRARGLVMLAGSQYRAVSR